MLSIGLVDKEDVSGDMWFPARQRLPDPPQAREPLPSGAQLRVAHSGWLSNLEGQHKNPTRVVVAHWAGGKMAAAWVSTTSGSQFSNILAEPSRSNEGMLHHSSSSYVVYPPDKPFLNCDLRCSPNKPTLAYSVSNSKAIFSALKNLQEKDSTLRTWKDSGRRKCKSLF